MNGKNALVCGSTQGIGKAVAVELANAGAAVTLVARNEPALQQTLTELSTSENPSHQYICVDFSNPEELRARIKAYVENNPPVHILLNNTGGPSPGKILEAETAEFEEAFSKHLICNQILVQALAPGMKAEKYGRIINIISTSVRQPIPGLGVSNTIRGAVASWSKTLAEELAPFGITVNNILPGYTRTRRLESLIRSKAEKSGKSISEVEKEMMAVIPAGRFAEAKELAYAAVFLSSPFAAYITGVSIPVDGGRIPCL